MIIINYLYYILFGFLFATIGYTILDGLCETLASLVLMIKTKIDVIIVRDSEKIKQLQEQELEKKMPLIGFSVSENDEGEEYFE